MDEMPIAKALRQTRKEKYDPQPLIDRVNELLKQHKESFREASLNTGLDHQAIRRLLAGNRPQMHVCILLADHFGINPNEFLQLAGWPTLKAFDVNAVDTANLPPEATEIALAVAKISEPGIRREVTDAMLILLKKYFS